MKLNVGSGNPENMYKRGWINLDCIRHDRVSVVGKGEQLPFKDNSIEEIHCVHVLEHLTRDKHLPFVQEMFRVCSGSVYIEVPDFLETCANLVSERDPERIRILTLSVYGKTERPGMAHHWGFTEDSLYTLLMKAGYVDQNIDYPTKMISNHYKQEPVILVKAWK